MSAQEVIKELQELPPAERAQVVKFVMEQNGSWNAEARQKINIGWEQAKSGQLRTPEQAQENLAARKEVWKNRSAQEKISVPELVLLLSRI
ncbi:MAG: hypothetical protein ABI042_03270 [Verrucomicrobiota bacterium]